MEEVCYIDGSGVLYDRLYRPLSVSLSPLPLPRPQSAQDVDEYAEAVREWSAAVNASLGAALLPLPVSRVYCRPPFSLRATPVNDKGAPAADDTDESDATDVVSSPRSGAASPRDPKERTLVSPRPSSTRLAPSRPVPPPRGQWRGLLLPVPPLAEECDEDGYAIALSNWAALIATISASLPPHPAQLPRLLGLARRHEDKKSEKREEREAGEEEQNDNFGEWLAKRAVAVSAWDKAIVSAEIGWAEMRAPLEEQRVLNKKLQTLYAHVSGKNASSNNLLGVAGRVVSPASKLRGATPVLSRLQPRRPASPQLRRLAVPEAPEVPERGRTSERIAVVDLFESDDEDEEEEDSNEESSNSPTIRGNNLLVLEKVPNVPLGTEKAGAIARLRATRLLGNLYVRRVTNAANVSRKGFATILQHKPRLFSLPLPNVWGSNVGEECPRLIIASENANVSQLVPDLEIAQLDLKKLMDDPLYRETCAKRASHICAVAAWDPHMSSSNTAAPSFASVKFALFSLLSSGPVTRGRLHAWLAEKHYRDYFLTLLREKMVSEIRLLDGEKEKMLPLGCTFAAVLFEAFRFFGETNSVTSAIDSMRFEFDCAGNDWHKFNVSALVVNSLMLFSSSLSLLSLATLRFICCCFSRTILGKSLRVLPFEEGVTEALCARIGIDSVSNSVICDLYRGYFFSLLESFKGSAQMSNECYIAVHNANCTLADKIAKSAIVFSPMVGEIIERLLEISLSRSSPTLALHSTFLLIRMFPFFKENDLFFGENSKRALPSLLFSAAFKIRSPHSRLLFSAILKYAAQMMESNFEAFYAKHSTTLIAHLTCLKCNDFADDFLLKLARKKNSSLLFGGSKGEKRSKEAGVTLWGTLGGALSSCATMSDSVRRRIFSLFYYFASRCPNIVSFPDLSFIVFLSSCLSHCHLSSLLLTAVSILLSRFPAARKNFSPLSARPAWRVLAELARGSSARYCDPETSAPPEKTSALSQKTSASGEKTSALPEKITSALPPSSSVCREVHKATFFLFESFVRACPDGAAELVSSRLLGNFLSAVAPHSPPGVAGTALSALASVLTLQPGEDQRAREKELRPLVAFLVEKRFHVQVHLVYRRQGGDEGSLSGLVRWATAVSSSVLVKELLVGGRDDAEYVRELKELLQLAEK